jgi:diguanylate cyclase (GGDEF)-like protein
VVYADLDNFKSVNDRFGHHAGDTVLKQFAELLKQSSRRSDICARIGGEEFLFVLTHNTEDARRSSNACACNSPKPGSNFKANVSVTASFGVTQFRKEDTQNFDALVRRADAALFEAKRQGRNRVEFGRHPEERLSRRRISLRPLLLARTCKSIHVSPRPPARREVPHARDICRIEPSRTRDFVTSQDVQGYGQQFSRFILWIGRARDTRCFAARLWHTLLFAE